MKPRISTFSTVLGSLIICVLCLSSRSGSAAEGPMQSLRKTHAKITALLGQKFKPGSSQEKKNREEVKKAVNAFLDYGELAKLALGKHWEARSEKERTEFVSILRDLIERNYIKQLRSNADYKLEYKQEKITGDTALVKTVIKVEKNGRITDISIDYKMRKVGKNWMVFDVITDEVSLVSNYRSQFNRIIKRESYEALVKKMKQKLKEEPVGA